MSNFDLDSYDGWTCRRSAGSSSAEDVTVSEETFGCILDWPKVRNTRFKHSDPEKLKEAMRILRDSGRRINESDAGV
ncbi:hypothetical protein W02_34860 [Nitrospira sp. KM1]|nr:hypothetical protein W02_34860 [Nitrospira sp. KM1]